jgi:hypothetical protein
MECFTKKRRYYFNALVEKSIEGSLFDIRYGYDSNFMVISEYLSMIDAISNYETEANDLSEIAKKIRGRENKCIIKRNSSKSEES